MPNSRTEAKSVMPPGGSGLVARRFLGRNLETSKNSVKMAGNQSSFIHTRHSSSYSIKNQSKQLPLPGIRTPIGSLTLVLMISKSFPFLLHTKLHSTSPKTPLTSLQYTLASTLHCSPVFPHCLQFY